MRTSVRLGQTAIAVLALSASLAAQGRGRGQDDKTRAEARAQQDARQPAHQPAHQPAQQAPQQARQQAAQQARQQAAQQAPHQRTDPRVVVSAPAHTDPRPVFGGRVNTDDRRVNDNRARVDERTRAEERARVDPRSRIAVRGRPDERRGLDNGLRRVDRPQVFERNRGIENWRGESRWRQDHARIVIQFFASPRYRYIQRYSYAALPFGWEEVVYDDGFFPYEYDQWTDEVPLDLEYQLPPLYRGYRRFIFGDRLIVIDRLTRHVVMVIRI